MGLLTKIAIAALVANKIADSDEDELVGKMKKKTEEVVSDAIRKKEEKKKSIEELKQSKYVYTVGKDSGKENKSSVKDASGKIKYSIEKKDNGKVFLILHSNNNLVATISCYDTKYAQIKYADKKKDKVEYKFSLKNSHYEASWSEWEIKSSLLGNHTYLSDGNRIALTEVVMFGEDDIKIYIEQEEYLRDVLLIDFAIQTISQYNSEQTSDVDYTPSKPSRKERKTAKKDNKENKKQKRRDLLGKLFEKDNSYYYDDYSSFDSDDDDD